MKRLADLLYNLLRPAPQTCPICLRELRGGGPASSVVPVRHPAARAELARLCGACLGSIPWIWRPLCPICGRPGRCEDCLRRKKTYFRSVRCAVQYKDAMKSWLADYKYKGTERFAVTMAAMLSGALEQLTASAGARFDLIVPVPLAPGRLEERGFNQAERLAEIVGGWYGVPYADLLVRVSDSEKQSRKGRSARIRDMQGLFKTRLPASQQLNSLTAQSRFLLIDDIYTTGSTMNECARALWETFPNTEIYGLAWARA